MRLFDDNETTKKAHRKADKKAAKKVPAGLFIACPKCGKEIFYKDLEPLKECPFCFYGFRQKAKEKVAWLVDDFEEFELDKTTENPLNFPGYTEKLAKAKEETDLNDSVLTGIAMIKDQRFALGVMDPYFIIGSLGTVAGEKLTELFEIATKEKLPVVVFTASGGARMQEGIHSLMQMAKISNAIAKHSEAGGLYISVLTDPTTGGVTASFAMQGDIILAEPHALIGFAGKRVIEQTIHQKIPDDLQAAETVLENGFIDAIVKRSDQKESLFKLLKLHQKAGDVND